MMEEPKRLKRGLKDISPLFEQDDKIEIQSRNPFKVSQPVSAVHSLGVFCPHDAKQNSFFLEITASQMKRYGHECALISIKEGKDAAKAGVSSGRAGNFSKHFDFSMNRLEEVCRLGSQAGESLGASALFFNFNYANPVQFQKVIPILDKWVLFLNGELESLTEAFRFIKMSSYINRGLEYYIAYEGADPARKAILLYERFSEIISRRVGLTLNWIGAFDRQVPASLQGLSLESLQTPSSRDTLEKRVLSGWALPEVRNAR